jgi:hypothetical protein
MGNWTGAWTGAAADVPAATSEAATGALTGDGGRCAGGRCAGSYVRSSDGVLDGGGDRHAGGYVESADNGISFFSIARVFSSGFFRREVEKMMGQERRLQ